MSPTPERPEPRRRRPVPPPDAGVDPILPVSAASTTPPPPPPTPVRHAARRGPVPTVQLNTRVAPEIDTIVNLVADERGWTKREVIEHALKVAYPEALASALSS